MNIQHIRVIMKLIRKKIYIKRKSGYKCKELKSLPGKWKQNKQKNCNYCIINVGKSDFLKIPFKELSYPSPEKAMTPYSSTLAWKIPWTEEPGRLQSMGSLRVGHDWATSLSLFTFMHWRRKWQPTPVLLPGESQGRGSLVGCRLWGRTESDTTEVT